MTQLLFTFHQYDAVHEEKRIFHDILRQDKCYGAG